MGFPFINGTRKSLAAAYTGAKLLTGSVKARTQDVRSKAAAGTLRRFDALSYMTHSARMRSDASAMTRGSPALPRTRRTRRTTLR